MGRLLTIIAIFVIIVLAGWYVYDRSAGSNSVSNPSVTPNPTEFSRGTYTKSTVQGEYVCLPHKDTEGPQTLECAFGIKADDGTHYALSMNDELQSQFQTGKRAVVEGLIVPTEALSTDQWRKYDMKGVMQVETAQYE